MNRLRPAGIGHSFGIAGFGMLLAAFSAPPASAAPGTCPWVTQGSAATALGGTVSARVEVSDSGQGSCTFTREGANETLRVVVARELPAACPENSEQLKGIGNQATLCRIPGAPGEVVELVVSRVRELHFTVSITLPSDTSQTAELARAEQAVKQIAEQVAGNLF